MDNLTPFRYPPATPICDRMESYMLGEAPSFHCMLGKVHIILSPQDIESGRWYIATSANRQIKVEGMSWSTTNIGIGGFLPFSEEAKLNSAIEAVVAETNRLLEAANEQCR